MSALLKNARVWLFVVNSLFLVSITQGDKETNDIFEVTARKNTLTRQFRDIFHTILKRAVCKPNQDFQNECNSCKCSADGLTYSCTQAECLERDMTKEVEVFMESEGVDHIERHSVCKPQDTFYIGCNTCHCNYDGTDFSCTNKPCPLPDDVELFHELNEMKPIVPFESLGSDPTKPPRR